MQEGSRRAIVAAMLANLGLAVAKFAAFLATGASSMLAESIHSVADTANQGLLFWGGSRARREPTPEHPFGFGRERYFWSFVVALVLFSLGAVFAIYEGVHKFQHPQPLVNMGNPSQSVGRACSRAYKKVAYLPYMLSCAMDDSRALGSKSVSN